MTDAQKPNAVALTDGLGLLPEREGQPRTLTITGPVPEAGHWYSPAAVREMLAEAREQQCAVLEQARETLQKTMGTWGGTCAWYADVKAAIAASEAAAEEDDFPDDYEV